MGAACSAAHVPLCADAPFQRLPALCGALSLGVRVLRHHILVLHPSARERHAARGVHLGALPFHVGRVVAKEIIISSLLKR